MLSFKKKKKEGEISRVFCPFLAIEKKKKSMIAVNNGRKSKPSVKQWITDSYIWKDVAGYLGKQIARRLDISPKRAQPRYAHHGWKRYWFQTFCRWRICNRAVAKCNYALFFLPPPPEVELHTFLPARSTRLFIPFEKLLLGFCPLSFRCYSINHD